MARYKAEFRDAAPFIWRRVGRELLVAVIVLGIALALASLTAMMSQGPKCSHKLLPWVDCFCHPC